MGNSVVEIQNSLSAGEISPSIWGRQDLGKYHSGTSTCRNFFADYRGGVLSRPGFAYVGTSKQSGSAVPPRLIPFQFSIDQGYVLEFGQTYLRIISDGAYLTEASVTVSSVSTAGLFTTSTSHGYSVGDWVYDVGNTGFSGLTWIIATVPTATTFTVTDLFGNVISSAAASASGTVSRIYTVVSPYAAVDLPYLKFTQSADVMTLTCVNTATETEYAPYNLVRSGQTSWAFTQETFAATIQPPTDLTVTAQSSAALSTWYTYVVTAVDSTTGEESNPSAPVYVQNNDIALFAGTNTLAWGAVAGADSYNVYEATPSYGAIIAAGGLFGFIGTSLGTGFSDTNYQPDFTQVPPQHSNPFTRGGISDVLPTAEGVNYSQQTIGYTVNTSTGSGFSGQPVSTNGGFSGFVIETEGQNYAPGDTITITDSGGGVAVGNFSFSGNPSAGDSLYFNGFQIEFRAQNDQTSPYDSVNLGTTTALTMQALAILLNAAPDLNVNIASYTYDTSHLYITYKTPGTVGNDYTYSVKSCSVATAAGSNLTGGGTVGSGATCALTLTPATGTYPGVCAYYQQRRVFGSSINNPDTYWMSQPGLFNNMDTSIPVTDSDAITGTPWAQQVNGIQFLVPMPGGLVILTGKGAWQLNGGSSAALTPSNQDATPQAYNGCSALVPPITINYDIIYVQAKGSIVRDLSYNFFVNIYTGTDLTVLSNHLFLGNTITQWAYAEEPFKMIWAVRNDGILLGLTYLKEQDVYSWTRHDTNGLFVSVCSVTEPPVDAVYCAVQRFVQGQWMYYVERLNNRIWNNVEESFCVDAGLAYPLNYPNATISAQAATGLGVTFTTSASVFNSGQVGYILRVGGGSATITGYDSPTQVHAAVNQPITDTVPNDPNAKPIPQTAGTWTLQAPVSSVTGLNHLEGLEVAVLADGSVVPNQIVTNNSVTLPEPASIVVVGLPYVCQVQTLYLDHPDQGGNTIQNRRKTISAVGLRVEQSRGLQIGADQIDASTQQNYATEPWINMVEIKDRTNQVTAGYATPLFTGDWYQAITSGWAVTGQVAVQQVYPLPANILSIISYFQTGDDK